MIGLNLIHFFNTCVGTSGAPGCMSPGGPPCATLRASANLNIDGGGIINMVGNNVVIDHIIIDGNRANRLHSLAAQKCASGTDNQMGLNANIQACLNCGFVFSATINALCGSGLQWIGADCTIKSSYVANNGDHFTQNMWSDGWLSRKKKRN